MTPKPRSIPLSTIQYAQLLEFMRASGVLINDLFAQRQVEEELQRFDPSAWSDVLKIMKIEHANWFEN